MSILKLQNLRKEFSSLVAVDDVSFSVEPGQVVGLIGPNGAGKTTLLHMLATLLPPTDGTASIFGFDIRKEPLEIRRKIGYLPDFFNLYPDLKIRECLDFFARAYGVPANTIPQRIEEVLDYVDLAAKKDSLIKHLSRGMVQRMGLATLLVRDPELFLLDEPASGLDPMARVQLRDILRRLSKEGRTVLISSHILSELSGFCSHIAIMSCGKLVMYGNVEEIERQIAGGLSFIIKVLSNSQEAQSIISGIETIELLNAEDHTFTVSCPGGIEAIAELNRRLVSQGIPVIELRQHKTSLEDMFVSLSIEKKFKVS